MTMVATKTMANFFKTSSRRQFLFSAQNDKKDTKIQFALLLSEIDVFFIIQTTESIS